MLIYPFFISREATGYLEQLAVMADGGQPKLPTRLIARGSVEILIQIRDTAKQMLGHTPHVPNCTFKEIPDDIFRSGVQIGGPGRSIAADSWERSHPCTCGLHFLVGMMRALEELEA